ncbi:hypothetical protein BDN72DRAFT_903935 [Pluteus cervinus]|uniref:Uncharacterized protein n=1 Tax=Pluteus cervinus TaxID=181527 RepID=A0ACD3A899_9AGAR|nr:hypothetical protein BDN72DRAFT_903935 [Pluteus cervinus]
MACDPEGSDGCSRCAPREPIICCDFCHPKAFAAYSVTYQQPSRAPPRSAIKGFTTTSMTEELKVALQDWRFSSAVQKYGVFPIKKNGSQFFLSDITIDRLVVCASAQKLTSVDSLVKETDFRQDLIPEFAQGLLDTVYKYFPLPPPKPPKPLENDIEKGTRVYSCSSCGASGHTSTCSFSFFPTTNLSLIRAE